MHIAAVRRESRGLKMSSGKFYQQMPPSYLKKKAINELQFPQIQVTDIQSRG